MKQISGAYQSSYGDDEGGASFWRSLVALRLSLSSRVGCPVNSRLRSNQVSLSAAPNPVASAKINVTGLSQQPPPKPNNSTDPGDSTYPPPSSKKENKSPQSSTSGEQTKKDDGATGNPSREEDTAKSGSSGSNKEESMSPTKLEDNYVVKETCGPQSTRCINDKLVASSVSYWDLFQQFPAYATLLTPIYGTYFLLVTVVLVGGTWVCCRFRKRGKRDDSGIPYQQLEMGAQPQSSSAAESNTVDGWDEWDDDWDDEAVTRPQKHTTTSVSPNGLSSRTPKKDVWDADWDD
ncbi:hypothetical protein GW17_00019850 [Ensete ventricosum]|nr:hypothetical protein GW17_00019850 [Ensete ventricosum]